MSTLFLESIVFIVMKIIITEEQLNTIINHNDKMIQAIKSLIDDIEMEGVCDVDVSKDEDEEMYSVYLVINPEWYLKNNKSWIDKDKKNASINKTKKEIYTKLNSYLNLTNLYVGSYVNPDNC
jgi:hypothetical protein